ncbi:MAG: hypothetical protein LBC42_03950, partial [Puniceicoccales bacterium]|nr:hypothetical protein [Puniceicoccales bacterium]
MNAHELAKRLRLTQKRAQRVLEWSPSPGELVEASIVCALHHLFEHIWQQEDSIDLSALGAMAGIIQKLLGSSQQAAEMRENAEEKCAMEGTSRGFSAEILRHIEEQ